VYFSLAEAPPSALGVFFTSVISVFVAKAPFALLGLFTLLDLYCSFPFVISFKASLPNTMPKVLFFGCFLVFEWFNAPYSVVADTDLHARKKKHLSWLGTSRIITNAQGESPEEIVNSMKSNIFNGEYFNVRQYVSAFHLLEAFCLPVLFSKLFYKPRA